MIKKFKETLVDVNYHEEIDLDYPFYNNGDLEPNEIDTSEMPDIWCDTESIDINVVINSLMDLKEKGANRVYIVAHEDHHGYIFTGVKLEEI